ncbi:hypothetical protein F3Y22_tig00113548pilonHSYRG00042 [Hibiscus syriacus]|uniref:Uncharacterized protein n=1 Tax=Hibiscus syriacus TaxID=106335 RepID=A0A6A2Y2M1_HIBSY|nr:hypothetical protein F3Y22_tig00113548pilonHSYRG00042 [Hibiscus syriacus]
MCVRLLKCGSMIILKVLSSTLDHIRKKFRRFFGFVLRVLYDVLGWVYGSGEPTHSDGMGWVGRSGGPNVTPRIGSGYPHRSGGYKGCNEQVNADYGGNLSGVSMAPEGVPSESSRMGVTNSGRKQMKRGMKVLGKLDLNVEFRNEAEELVGGRSNAGIKEDNNEGNGFFEGLDEFFGSLPILSVVGDDKVKATE